MTEVHRTDAIPYYCRALDFERLLEEYPPAPLFYDRVYRLERARLRAIQEERFLEQVRRAWQIPFYRRRWEAAGLAPGDVRSLDDLGHLPTYTVYDIRDSIERNPPFGDFMGITPHDGLPLVLQTSGGTTGMPRPHLYAPKEREVMALLRGRCLHMHGVRPGDLVQSTFSLGLSNGGFLMREAIWKYTGAVPIMTGAGNSTPTKRQIEIIRAWHTTVLTGFPAYLRHMALVARDELGVDPRSLGIRLLSSHLGVEDRRTIEDLWSAPCYDSYGIHEAGLMAAECSHQRGMHIYEDAFILEVGDPETGRSVPVGARGNVFITTLYKHGAPVIRYDVNDISSIMPGTCACGSTLVRLEKIFGRADNMVKLRGANVFPEAIGALLGGDARLTGEYVCVVQRVGEAGRDEMTVMVEIAAAGADRGSLQAELEGKVHDAVGVRIGVVLVERGGLDQYTGLTQTSKIKRLVDRRQT